MKRHAVMNFIHSTLAGQRDYLFIRHYIKRTVHFVVAAFLCLLIIQLLVVSHNFAKWHVVDFYKLQSRYDGLVKKMEQAKHSHAVVEEAEAGDLHLTRVLVELAKVRPTGIKFTTVNADKQAVAIEGFADKTEKVHLFSNKISACDNLFTGVETQNINLEENLITFKLVAGVKCEVKE